MEVGHWGRGPGAACAVLCRSVDAKIITCKVLLVCLSSPCHGVTPLGTHSPWPALPCCQGCADSEHVPVLGPAPEPTRAAVAQKEMLSPMLCVPWLVSAAEWSIQEPLSWPRALAYICYCPFWMSKSISLFQVDTGLKQNFKLTLNACVIVSRL